MNNMNAGMDLEAISRRIMELAQAAVEEHVASIGRSQAESLMELVALTDAQEHASHGKWRS